MVKADLVHIRARRSARRTIPALRENARGEREWSGPRERAQAAIGALIQQGTFGPDAAGKKVTKLILPGNGGPRVRDLTGTDLLFLTRDRLSFDPDYPADRQGYMHDETIYAAAEAQGLIWRSVKTGRPPGS